MSSSQSTLLVTGGAGYIGSHTVRLLAEMGERVVVLDNLELGHRDAVISENATLVVGNLGDAALLDRIFSEHCIEAVLHFGAYSLVGESVTEPLKYYQNNAAEPLVLLQKMKQHGTHRFIFSSTCATYGNPVAVPMDETHPQQPINPYGWSKLFLEQAVRDSATWGLRSVILRYFNACGCALDGRLGEDHRPESHLIPRTLMAATGELEKLTIFGTDYDTPDGTCIRDYIHVLDLAEAHAAALQHLRNGGESTALNLGTGQGISVREILRHAEAVSGKKIPVEYGPRRAGDPAVLVANPAKAKTVLGWEAKITDPREIVASAWQWISGPRRGRYDTE